MKLKEGRVGINGSLALVSQQVSRDLLHSPLSIPGLDLQRHLEGKHPAWLADERGLVPTGHRGLCAHLRSEGEQ